MAEAVGALSAVRGAGLLAPAAVAELEFPGTGSMGGMGFPSLLCSLKTWNRPRSPVRPSLGLLGLPEETGRTPRGVQGWEPTEGRAPLPPQPPVTRPGLSSPTPSRSSFLLPGPTSPAQAGPITRQHPVLPRPTPFQMALARAERAIFCNPSASPGPGPDGTQCVWRDVWPEATAKMSTDTLHLLQGCVDTSTDTDAPGIRSHPILGIPRPPRQTYLLGGLTATCNVLTPTASPSLNCRVRLFPPGLTLTAQTRPRPELAAGSPGPAGQPTLPGPQFSRLHPARPGLGTPSTRVLPLLHGSLLPLRGLWVPSRL